jgi:hypothetical protein
MWCLGRAVRHRAKVAADNGGVRYYIAGEYEQPTAERINLALLHAVRVGEPYVAECGYAFRTSDWSMSDDNMYDWEDPRWMQGGMRCQECVEATGVPA